MRRCLQCILNKGGVALKGFLRVTHSFLQMLIWNYWRYLFCFIAALKGRSVARIRGFFIGISCEDFLMNGLMNIFILMFRSRECIPSRDVQNFQKVDIHIEWFIDQLISILLNYRIGNIDVSEHRCLSLLKFENIIYIAV